MGSRPVSLFCNDLVFFCCYTMWMGMAMGTEGSETTGHLVDEIGWLVCSSTWGWKRTQSAGEIFFFSFPFFLEQKVSPNEENLDSSLLFFSLIIFIFISHHPSLPSSPSPTRYPLATPFLPSSISAPLIFPFSSRSYAIDAPSASASA